MNDYIYGQGDGLLTKDGHRLFPIGFYELPKGDAELKAMSEAGVNLIRCGNRENLDRITDQGMMGWVSLPVHAGVTDNLRQQIESVVATFGEKIDSAYLNMRASGGCKPRW